MRTKHFTAKISQIMVSNNLIVHNNTAKCAGNLCEDLLFHTLHGVNFPFCTILAAPRNYFLVLPHTSHANVPSLSL